MHGVARWVLLAGLTPAMSMAQSAAPDGAMPRPYRGVHVAVGGIFVTPVAGSPFSATVQIVSHAKLPDGTEHVTTTHNRIARTASGRIYNERREMVSTEFRGEPALLSARIYDPASRQSITLLPSRHLAREVTLRAPQGEPERALPPLQRPRLEDEAETALGTKMMDGVELTGVRREHTVPAATSGTGKPVVVVDETWYAPALSIYTMIRHDDPRTGEQLVAVTKVDRAEPPATMFAIPASYKIVDETTEDAPVAAR